MDSNPSSNEDVIMEDQNEISRVKPTESTVTVNVSVAENTLTEGESNGGTRASVGGKIDSVEPLANGSDVCIKGDSVIYVGGDDKTFDGVRVSENEEQKAGIEASKVELEAQTSTEATQVVVEGETVAVHKEDDHDLSEKPSSFEDNQSLETADVSGSREEIGVMDAVPSEGATSHLNGDLRATNAGCSENTTSTQDEKQEPVVQVGEIASNKVDGDEKVNLHPVEENLKNGASVTVDLDTAAKITDGSFPVGILDSEVEEPEACVSFTHEDQNVEPDVSVLVTPSEEKNQPIEVVAEKDATSGSCKQDESRIMGSHGNGMGVSQFSVNGSNMGSITIDLDICHSTDGDRNTGDKVAEGDVYTPSKPHGEGPEVNEEIHRLDQLDEYAAKDATEVGHNGNRRVETEEQVPEFEEQNKEKKSVKQAALCPGTASMEKGGQFSVSDLVWGKVKSHPWWPGQIFHPSDASKLAKKYHKKDRFLVAYFGDQTFAWNDASSLKPFKTHFSQMEKQTNLEPFLYAVDSALDEISRRVQLGMACNCTPDEAYEKIQYQTIKNAGIQAEASRKKGVDKNLSVTTFEPGKLVKYVKSSALHPFGGGDRLELVTAQAQLMAFYRSKGYVRLPEFIMYGGLLESDAEHTTPVAKAEEQTSSGNGKMKNQDRLSQKDQNTSDDGHDTGKKERSLSELMSDKNASSSHSAKKRKDVEGVSDDLTGQTKKQMLTPSSYANPESQTPRTFKVGESIRKIAKQLTTSPQILNGHGGRFQKTEVKVGRSNEKLDGVGLGGSSNTPKESRGRRNAVPKEYSSPDEMLSQLGLAARDPMKGYSFLTIIVDFFTEFRNSISLEVSSSGKRKRSGTKKGGARNGKPSSSKASSSETYDYEDTKDSYWTDRIIQSSSEEKPTHKKRGRKQKSQLESPMKKDTVEPSNLPQLNLTEDSVYRPTVEPGNYSQSDPTLDFTQQYFDGNTNMVVENPVGSLNENSEEDLSPTALILNFTDADSIPPEMHLNKIFSRFGPLKESETEILRKTSRARVVFKKRNDAETAFSSAGKYSIFGPALASYQLRYLPSTPSKASYSPTTTGRKDAGSLEGDTT